MRPTARSLVLLLPLLALPGLGCKGHDNAHSVQMPNLSQPAPEQGTLSLALRAEGSRPSAGAMRLRVTGVDVRTPAGTWVPVSEAARLHQVDLTGAEATPCLAAAPLPTGDYRAVRLRLGPAHRLVRPGAEEELMAPETLVVEGAWRVEMRETSQLELVVDPRRALQRGRTRVSLAAEGLALQDVTRYRVVQGTLRDAGNGLPIADARVTLQAPARDRDHREGGPTDCRIVRAAVTGPDGAFRLDAVPPGLRYRVVVPPTARHDLVLGAVFDLGSSPVPPVDLQAEAPASPAQFLDLPSPEAWNLESLSHEWVVERRVGGKAPGFPGHVLVEVVPLLEARPLHLGPYPQGTYRVRFVQGAAFGPQQDIRVGAPR